MRFVRFFIIAGIMSFTTLGGAAAVFAAAPDCRIALPRPHEAGRAKPPRRLCASARKPDADQKKLLIVVADRLPGQLR